MKKIICVIISCVLFASVLIACGDDSTTKAIKAAQEEIEEYKSKNISAGSAVKSLTSKYDEQSKTFNVYLSVDEDDLLSAAAGLGFGDSKDDAVVDLLLGIQEESYQENLIDPIQKKYFDELGIQVKLIIE